MIKPPSPITLLLTLLLTLTLSLTAHTQSQSFKAYTYSSALSDLQALTKEDPNNIFTMDYAEDIFAELPVVQCPTLTPGGATQNAPCKTPILKITNWDHDTIKIRELPQVLLIAGLHGDEQIGIYTLIEMVKYISGNYESLRGILAQRMIIIVPFANAQGFANGSAFEKVGGSTDVDPEKDFPFMNEDCFNTSTAKLIDQLYRRQLIISTLVFKSGAEKISLGYPFGYSKSNNPELVPDQIAYKQITSHLSESASSNKAHPEWNVNKYEFGQLASLYGSAAGSFEDWAYAGSWEEKMMTECQPKAGAPYQQGKKPYSINDLRAFIVTANISLDKTPKLETFGTAQDILDYSNKNGTDGFISRNIRMAIEFIKLVTPHIYISRLWYSNKMQKLVLKYEARGCFESSFSTVDWMYTENTGKYSMSRAWHSPGVRTVHPKNTRQGY
jgi:hypothetical protein